MENITELVRRRRSVRTFDGREVNEDDLRMKKDSKNGGSEDK